MKKTSKMIMMVLVVMMFLCISVSASAETVLQFGTTVNEQDSFQVAAEKFAELVNERTDGAYVIEIYPNGTLGGEADMLESMSMGMLDMGIITAGPFVNYSSMMGVLDMPFLFANNEEAYKILDGEIGHELLPGGRRSERPCLCRARFPQHHQLREAGCQRSRCRRPEAPCDGE